VNNTIIFPRHMLGRVRHSRFVRNVVLVASGTAGAQAISLAFAPVITRIYGPEAFGLLGTFTAIVSVVAPAAALAFPIAIVLPKDDRDALGLVSLSLVLSFAVALLATILLVLGGDWLGATLAVHSIVGFLFLVPVAMLFSAWLQIAQQWMIRKSEFGVIARSAVAHSLVLNSSKAGLGWLYPVGPVLIVLATLGNALHAVFLYIGARRRWLPEPLESSGSANRRKPSLCELAHRYRDFPCFRAPQNLINAASQSLPVLMLAALFGPAAAGFYTLGMMVMGAPSALLGKAVNDVFYPRITAAARNGENVAQHIVRVTSVMFVACVVPFGLVVAFGPELFSFVFGSEWTVAGDYARWLAFFFLFNFINKPSVASVPVLGIQRGLLIYEVFSTGSKALALVAGFYLFGSDIWAVALFSLSGVVAYIMMMFWILMRAIRWRADAKTS
jgi:O-antigen/teichoic acid export membrane protein